MCFELLYHRTPPSCISPSILTVASAIFPNSDVVKELPTTCFICQLQTVILAVIETLVAYQLTWVLMFAQMFTDGTSHHRIEMKNLIIRFVSDNGFKCITLSSSIFAKPKSADVSVIAIMNAFKEGRELLML